MYILVYNPKARRNKGEKSLQEVIDIIDEEYLAVNVLEIHDKFFFDSFPATDTIVLIGGDGTIGIFINKYKVKQKLMIYAGGTGNDFMRNYSEELVEYGDNVDKPYVLVKDDKRYISNGFGVGVDAEVLRLYNNSRTKSRLAYFYFSIKAFFSYEPTNAEVTIDGKTNNYKKVFLVVVQNGNNFGGGMNVAPGALNNDGILDLCIVHGIGRLKLLYHFPKVYKGKHIKVTKYFAFLKGKDVTIKLSKKRPFQTDGELSIAEYDEFQVLLWWKKTI